MTGQQLYQHTLALMFEEDCEAYAAELVALINILLAEVSPTNNSIRKAKGKQPLSPPPRIASLEEDLPLEEELLLAALPYGLAAKLIYDDNDMNKVGYYQGLYVSAIKEAARLIPSSVKDVYQ